MRTRILLLTAGLAAAGAATSMAAHQNAVGHVTKTIPPNGFALISNPLIAADNSINALFSPAPPGFSVFKFESGRGGSNTGFAIATFDDLDGAFLPADVAALTVVPGEGVFVRNPTGSSMTITFIGEVPQGALSNPLPMGLSIRSSQVPQAGTAEELGLVGGSGDSIFQWNTANQNYDVSTFDDLDNAWLPPLGTLEVGDAFFLSKQSAGSWDRIFEIN